MNFQQRTNDSLRINLLIEPAMMSFYTENFINHTLRSEEEIVERVSTSPEKSCLSSSASPQNETSRHQTIRNESASGKSSFRPGTTDTDLEVAA